ncbi:MAG: hypothetical protein CMF59_18660 [Leptospiraceae bacterium]|nr:hypothetical protein [Leptospiraceae bacterium]
MTIPVTNCLLLEQPYSDGVILPALLSGASNPVYFFLSDESGSTQARSIVKRDMFGGLRLLTWNGGPGNIWKGAVVNGVIFALENNNQDDIWISRDDAQTWELVDAPGSNESENISNVLGCGSAVVITHPTIAYNGSGTRPGYISYDSGVTWQEFRVGASPAATGTGDYALSAIDCTAEKVFVASSAVANRFQWASISNLSSWTVATSHPASQNGYSSIATSGTSTIGLACTTPGYCPYNPDVNYSLNNAEGMALSGTMPHMGLDFTGVAEYGAGAFFVSELDQTNDICRIYNLGDGSTSPSSSSIVASLSCGDITNPQRMPALLVTDAGIFSSYASFSGTETDVVYSTDGLSNLTRLNIGSVYSGDGIVTSIDDMR